VAIKKTIKDTHEKTIPIINMKYKQNKKAAWSDSFIKTKKPMRRK
jgi:hypothetical protein